MFFRNKKERDDIWENRNILKEKHDMLIDEWVSLEERRKRFEKMDRVKKLRKDIKEKMGEIEIEVAYDMEMDYCVILIRAKKYKWQRDRCERV